MLVRQRAQGEALLPTTAAVEALEHIRRPEERAIPPRCFNYGKGSWFPA